MDEMHRTDCDAVTEQLVAILVKEKPGAHSVLLCVGLILHGFEFYDPNHALEIRFRPIPLDGVSGLILRMRSPKMVETGRGKILCLGTLLRKYLPVTYRVPDSARQSHAPSWHDPTDVSCYPEAFYKAALYRLAVLDIR